MKNAITIARLYIHGFMRAKSGNVAMIFALALLPLVLVAGIALEYSGASAVRVKLQAATDAAALAGSGVSPWTEEGCMARALDAFGGRVVDQSLKSQYPPIVACGEIGTSFSAEAQIPTSLLGALGIKSIEVAASSATTCGLQSDSSSGSTPIAWQQTALPDTTRVVTLGTTIFGTVYYWRTENGNPIVRLDNPHEGPATIVIRSVPAAPEGNMSFDVPEQGQFFVILPFVPAGQITLFAHDGPSPRSGGSATWNNTNNRTMTTIPGTPIYDEELERRCWISQ